MTTPSLADSTRWVDLGSALCEAQLQTMIEGGRSDAALREPSGLPDWSRGHVVAHLIGNGEGITRLLTWAATGEPAAMYASRERRNSDIEERSRWSASELQNRFVQTLSEVAAAEAAVPDDGWQRIIIAGQNRDGSDRVVPARVVPWMRAREVMVHAVDLNTGLGFADLPQDFVRSLADDIIAKRRADAEASADVRSPITFEASDTDFSAQAPGPRGWTGGEPIRGTLAEITAHLAGRTPLASAPALSAWL